MPTYEYVCEGCGCKFERFQSITAKPVRTCPECGQNKAKRLIGTGGGIIFKGSGFYETDYRSEDYKKAAEQEKKSADKLEAWRFSQFYGLADLAVYSDAAPGLAAHRAIIVCIGAG